MEGGRASRGETTKRKGRREKELGERMSRRKWVQSMNDNEREA